MKINQKNIFLFAVLVLFLGSMMLSTSVIASPQNNETSSTPESSSPKGTPPRVLKIIDSGTGKHFTNRLDIGGAVGIEVYMEDDDGLERIELEINGEHKRTSYLGGYTFGVELYEDSVYYHPSSGVYIWTFKIYDIYGAMKSKNIRIRVLETPPELIIIHEASKKLTIGQSDIYVFVVQDVDGLDYFDLEINGELLYTTSLDGAAEVAIGVEDTKISDNAGMYDVVFKIYDIYGSMLEQKFKVQVK